MPQRVEIVLSDERREVLERWARRPKSSQALALRCRIVLAAAEGEQSKGHRRRAGLHRLDGRQVARALRRPRPRRLA
jgi:hypothetical protein